MLRVHFFTRLKPSVSYLVCNHLQGCKLSVSGRRCHNITFTNLVLCTIFEIVKRALHYNTFHTSIISKPQTDCGRQQGGAVTLFHVQTKLMITHHILRKITTSRQWCQNHLACHASFTLHTIWTGKSNAMVISKLHINFLFHMPWNFT